MAIQTIYLVEAAMFLGAALSIGLGSFGAGVGEGLAAGQANEAITRSPKSADAIIKNMLVGMAVAESTAIFALVVALMLLFSVEPSSDIPQVFTLISAGICMGSGTLGSGIGSSLPMGAACLGIARQPRVADKLTINMLTGSAVCQTPAILALVVAFILIFTNTEGIPCNPHWASYLGAGISTGLAAIGTGYGSGLVAAASCEGAARQPQQAKTMMRTMLLGQAVTQTSAIYGMLISFVLLFMSYETTTAWAPAMALLSAGIAMGLGACAPGVGEGYVSRCAMRGISRNAGHKGLITQTMLVAMAVVESCAIYALVIALVLIFLT